MAGVLNNQNYTEDEIREMAGYILGFKEEIKNVKAGVGQLTTFNQLGFKGVNVNQMVGIFQIIQMILQLY